MSRRPSHTSPISHNPQSQGPRPHKPQPHQTGIAVVLTSLYPGITVLLARAPASQGSGGFPGGSYTQTSG